MKAQFSWAIKPNTDTPAFYLLFVYIGVVLLMPLDILINHSLTIIEKLYKKTNVNLI